MTISKGNFKKQINSKKNKFQKLQSVWNEIITKKTLNLCYYAAQNLKKSIFVSQNKIVLGHKFSYNVNN